MARGEIPGNLDAIRSHAREVSPGNDAKVEVAGAAGGALIHDVGHHVRLTVALGIDA